MNQLEQKLEQDFGIVFSQKDLLETPPPKHFT